MAGASTYTAVLDANVLYPIYTSDLVLSLSDTRLFHARWSKDIEDEAKLNLVERRPDLKRRIPKRFAAMRNAIPDCMIENYQPLIDSLKLPDPNDRHVLAAAIVGHADAIVTFNLKDFPQRTVSKFNIEVIHLDDFVITCSEAIALKDYER
jgi:predicted nucleic acid-binding protein